MAKTSQAPSSFGIWLLKRVTSADIQYSVLGDFEEIYADIADEEGALAAERWFWSQIMRSLPVFFWDVIYWKCTMFKNYLAVAFRHIARQKGYASINVSGLAIGITSCFLIAIYIHNELGFDTYHAQAERIARVTFDFKTPDVERALAMVGPPVGPALKEKYPEIEESVRFLSRPLLLQREDRPDIQYQEDRVVFADAPALGVFSFSMYRGDPKTALVAPYSIVLTSSAVQKYFEGEDPIGKILVGEGSAYTVTGVVEDVPGNSHFAFDFLASFSTIETESPQFADEFWALVVDTYILLADRNAAPALEAKLPEYLESQIGEAMRLEEHSYRLGTEPLDRIYLFTRHHSSLAQTGNVEFLYVFAGIALFILLIACINFVNLSTARAIERAKEVGVRKAIGALRRQLAFQFFGETSLMIFFALSIAAILTAVLLPPFMAFSGKSLSLSFVNDPLFVIAMVCLVLALALLAGGYPALVISRFQPVAVLRGAFRGTRRGTALHKTLVVFQFGLSIGLMICTAIVFSQLDYMRNARLGYEDANMLNIAFQGDQLVRERSESIKQALSSHPGVTSVSVSGDIPARGNLHSAVEIEASNRERRSVPWRFLSLDFDFIDNYGIEVIAGRNFSRDFSTDSTRAMIINEAAAADLGYLSPGDALGAEFRYGGREGTIIGVTRDFHLKSLQQAVEPAYMLIDPARYRYVSLRLETDDLSRTVADVETIWREFAPHRPFEYSFLDQSLDRLYRGEERFGSVVGLFAMLAIFIACMGLFGLASLSIRQRTREIGLRKVLGASSSRIVLLVTGEFARLVLIAFIVASPIVYWAADSWLNGFAYRIDVSWPAFLLAGSLALIISWLTIGYQAFSVAGKNPISSLQGE